MGEDKENHMRKITLATAAALFAFGTMGASAQMSGTAPGANTQSGPAMQGGRTGMTPGVSGSGTINPSDPAAQPTTSGTKSTPNTQAGGAQQGGRVQATPGGTPNSGTMDSTGTVTPRPATGPGAEPHTGPAQQGGRAGTTGTNSNSKP
ncbi:MAG: hypothetical protein B7Y84_13865 [Azorhizobium sp. 32-67-21]|nr:MAG: hypothetical protein B7Y84_13865 [Azorhizobium sp. 32-67-21]